MFSFLNSANTNTKEKYDLYKQEKKYIRVYNLHMDLNRKFKVVKLPAENDLIANSIKTLNGGKQEQYLPCNSQNVNLDGKEVKVCYLDYPTSIHLENEIFKQTMI